MRRAVFLCLALLAGLGHAVTCNVALTINSQTSSQQDRTPIVTTTLGDDTLTPLGNIDTQMCQFIFANGGTQLLVANQQTVTSAPDSIYEGKDGDAPSHSSSGSSVSSPSYSSTKSPPSPPSTGFPDYASFYDIATGANLETIEVSNTGRGFDASLCGMTLTGSGAVCTLISGGQADPKNPLQFEVWCNTGSEAELVYYPPQDTRIILATGGSNGNVSTLSFPQKRGGYPEIAAQLQVAGIYTTASQSFEVTGVTPGIHDEIFLHLLDDGSATLLVVYVPQESSGSSSGTGADLFASSASTASPSSPVSTTAGTSTGTSSTTISSSTTAHATVYSLASFNSAGKFEHVATHDLSLTGKTGRAPSASNDGTSWYLAVGDGVGSMEILTIPNDGTSSSSYGPYSTPSYYGETADPVAVYCA